MEKDYKQIETEWANYSNGYYGYNVVFKVCNLSSSHEIQAVISYYDSDGNLIKNDNLSGGTDEPIFHGDVEDNVTVKFEDYQKSYANSNSFIDGGITKEDYCEVDHIKIDIVDISENKLLCTVNETFNMSNLFDPHKFSLELEEDSIESGDEDSLTDSAKEFFDETDYNEDGRIDFDEFSELSYVFAEDSYWDGYSTEEILQSEWDRLDSNGDGYLNFEEFKQTV